MTEDDKLIYDIEGDWQPRTEGTREILIFQNKQRESFYRVIDMKKQEIKFTDPGRITKVVDINKVLCGESDSDDLKKKYLEIINMMADATIPITMPYCPTEYTCYIEAFPGFSKDRDDTLGILYFKHGDEMIPCKKFIFINPEGARIRYTALNFDQYNKLKSDWMRRCEDEVDSDTDKKQNN